MANQYNPPQATPCTVAAAGTSRAMQGSICDVCPISCCRKLSGKINKKSCLKDLNDVCLDCPTRDQILCFDKDKCCWTNADGVKQLKSTDDTVCFTQPSPGCFDLSAKTKTKIDSTTGTIAISNSPTGCFNINIPPTIFKSSDDTILIDFTGPGPTGCFDLRAPCCRKAWLSFSGSVSEESWGTMSGVSNYLDNISFPDVLISGDDIISLVSLVPGNLPNSFCITKHCIFNVEADNQIVDDDQRIAGTLYLRNIDTGVIYAQSVNNFYQDNSNDFVISNHFGITAIVPPGKYVLEVGTSPHMDKLTYLV